MMPQHSLDILFNLKQNNILTPILNPQRIYAYSEDQKTRTNIFKND